MEKGFRAPVNAQYSCVLTALPFVRVSPRGLSVKFVYILREAFNIINGKAAHIPYGQNIPDVYCFKKI